MNYIFRICNYILKGFGYSGIKDFNTSVFKLAYVGHKKVSLSAITAMGTIRTFIDHALGLDIVVFLAFVVLIVAEFQTGIKASMKKGERFKSRKFGRMIVKIGVYTSIICVLHLFASKMTIPKILGFEINPFLWLYYIVFLAVVFQLFISWMENLAGLGYAELKGISGIVLRKLNKYFEFDGSKDGDNFG